MLAVLGNTVSYVSAVSELRRDEDNFFTNKCEGRWKASESGDHRNEIVPG